MTSSSSVVDEVPSESSTEIPDGLDQLRIDSTGINSSSDLRMSDRDVPDHELQPLDQRRHFEQLNEQLVPVTSGAVQPVNEALQIGVKATHLQLRIGQLRHEGGSLLLGIRHRTFPYHAAQPLWSGTNELPWIR